MPIPQRHIRHAVARAARLWQTADMSRPPHSPQAGGMPIALGTLAGAVGGAILGEATIGLLVGLAIGSVIALWIWRRDRR
jgi:hypothetical protein